MLPVPETHHSRTMAGQQRIAIGYVTPLEIVRISLRKVREAVSGSVGFLGITQLTQNLLRTKGHGLRGEFQSRAAQHRQLAVNQRESDQSQYASDEHEHGRARGKAFLFSRRRDHFRRRRFARRQRGCDGIAARQRHRHIQRR